MASEYLPVDRTNRDNVQLRCLGNTPLMLAAADQDVVEVQQRLDDGASVNEVNDVNETPLFWSIRTCHWNEGEARKVIELLIQRGAELDTLTVYGETALMRATTKNAVWLTKLLIEKGANVNLRGPDGTTAISRIESAPSLVKKRKTVLKLLEQAGGVR